MTIRLILDSRKSFFTIQIEFITPIIHLVHLFQIVCYKFRLWLLGYIPFGSSLNEGVRSYSVHIAKQTYVKRSCPKMVLYFSPIEEHSL